MKKVFLIDCDGTLYKGNEPIKYASDFIKFLNKNSYKYLALTNCPSKSANELSEKFLKMGIEIFPNNILTSGMTSAKILKNKFKIKSAFVLGTKALYDEMEKEGIISDDKNPDAVLIGYDTDLTYERLKTACSLVLSGAKLFATNIDNSIPDKDSFIPHTGAIAKAVEFATGINCIYFGKPQKHMFDVASHMLKADKERFVMLGDRLDTDVEFANNCNISSYLMLTGFTTLKQLENSAIKPTKHFNNLKNLIAYEEMEVL